MQIGVRWRGDQAPHPTVPSELHGALAELTRDLSDPAAAWWTLTWLEGRPWCTLGDGTQVMLAHDGSVRIVQADEATPYDGASDDDDWLEA